MSVAEPATCFRNSDDDPWHDFDVDEGTATCGAKPFSEPGKGTRWAVAEVNPQPACTDCREKT